MSIDSSVLANTIIDLVNRGYITVEISNVNALETYNLDGTLKRLSEVFDEANQKFLNVDTNIAEVVNLIEAESGKSVSSLDLEMIRHWFNDLGYSKQQVDEAIYKASKNKKLSVKYVDRILSNQNKKSASPEDNDEIKDLISRVYVRK